MASRGDVNTLLSNVDACHDALIEQARALSRFREIVAFLDRCLDFMERHVPESTWRPWLEANQSLPSLIERGSANILSPSPAKPGGLLPIITSGSSATSDVFSFLTENVNYLEDSESREEYTDLASTYRALLAGPEQQGEVIAFFAPWNTVIADKFGHSVEALHALPREEDPQGPLLEMRSAIDIALDALLKLTPLTRRERGDLKRPSLIPTIAQHLGKDDVAKLDLILSNHRFQKLMDRLSAAKEVKLERGRAETLMAEAIALLHLMASTLALPPSAGADKAPPNGIRLTTR